jgi:hypothetical protein
MRHVAVLMLLSTCLVSTGLGASAGHAADGCGPGCHSAVNGGCVVDGWEVGAAVWNECPAGAHPGPSCYSPYVWRKQARACLHVN